MKKITARLVMSAFAMSPLTAFAQVTTLTYQSSVIEGTSSYLPSGLESPLGEPLDIPTTPFLGTLTASITLDGSLSANDLALVSESVDINGVNIISGTAMDFSFVLPTEPEFEQGAPNFCGPGPGCIDITESNGLISGATVDISVAPYHGSSASYQIGPGGDSLTYLFATTDGVCQNFGTNLDPQTGEVQYSGSTINPCSLSGSNTTAGVWTVTQAPEIDVTSAASGFALLAGLLVVARGRRQEPFRVTR